MKTKKLQKIDRMPSCRMKLILWVKFGKKYGILNQMPEILELYYQLRRRGEMSLDEFNALVDTNIWETIQA